MATAILESAFTTGEVSPALFGNVQLARMHSAAATMRNFFCSYQGGAYSRAGTAFVGFSKQTGRSYPPRIIPFQFSINQGLALEFGNFYMRVIFDGALVTEAPSSIIGVTEANPGVVTIANFSAVSASANNASVTSNYNPGDRITLAGIAVTPAQLVVETTALASLTLSGSGQGYAPNDVIGLAGGAFVEQATVQVTATQVLNATVVSGGTGGTPGAATITGTTGTGTKFQASVTISSGGALVSINAITVNGVYTENPTNLSAEPVTGGSLSGATVSLVMSAEAITVLDPGSFTANAPGGIMTQVFTSGNGTGASFNGALFGPGTLSVSVPGNYNSEPSNPVSQGSTTGTGAGASFNVTFGSGSFNAGDWIALSSVAGMPALNGQTVVVQPVGSGTYAMYDVYGHPIDTTTFGTYTGGGLAARVYTLPTFYSEVDLKYLKFTQSADVMSLCCVNQDTGTEYQPVNLSRMSDTDWTFSPAVPPPEVLPPASVSGSASSAGSVEYQYVITSISPADGSESVASNIASITSAVDITATAGTITLTWSVSLGVNQYNIYKAAPGFEVAPPPGSLFGYAGTAFGTQFIDSNIIADFSQVPPTNQNPFARGQVIGFNVVSAGSGYTSLSLTVNSRTGTGIAINPVIVGGSLVAGIIEEAGQNYAPGDTVTIGGDGSGAAATLTIGPQSGTYPGVVAYFQERRAYGYTLNQPDTYFMSEPGAFTNFNTRTPTIDSDAITGSPWSVQVDGIQWMIPIGGALLVMTGQETFLLTGAGGSAFTPQPLTPASQSAQPQGIDGISPTVQPIQIYQDVLYVQSKGSTYRDFKFDISNYSYTADDITQNSTHLFRNYQIIQHAWCEEPYRVLWAIRNDGILLSLTWLKSEKIAGWSRHDTFGSFVSLCSVDELPVDALYLAAQRTIGTETAYTLERMNDRLWDSIEDAWCVDCGFSLPMSEPEATLSASSPSGLGAITGVTNLVGGSGYTAATTVSVVDDNGKGPGSGATATPTIVGGVITGITFTAEGEGYTYPQIVISDPAGSAGGSGASATAILNNTMTFSANEAVFSSGNVGSVIRMGGGVATITGFTDSEHVTANITTPISQTYPDANGIEQVIPQEAGNWTLSAPVTTVGGLNALIGATVTGLADGIKISPQTVSAQGTITLSTPASKITVGLPFQAQLQSVYLDAGEPTIQGNRKNIPEATARIEASGPFKMGSNQVDGSTLSPKQIAPQWSNLQDAPIAPTLVRAPYNSNTVPLATGDILVTVNSGDAKPGQVCVQQDDPYPLNVLAFIPQVLLGDVGGQNWPQKEKQ